MKANDFVLACKNLSKRNTVYAWGTFGPLLSNQVIDQKKAQYPDWYTKNRIIKLRDKVNDNAWAFDCVGMIKGILWGWNGDASKTYGGAKYGANEVPDIDANAMIKRCADVSSDFSDIIPGEVVWVQGHIGVYVGNGLVVECTTAWKNCVQVTACANIGTVKDYHARKWSKHGKLPWVEYGAPDQAEPKEQEVEDVAKYENLNVIIDGKQVALPGINIDGKVSFTIRDIAPYLGYRVSANGATPVLTKK